MKVYQRMDHVNVDMIKEGGLYGTRKMTDGIHALHYEIYTTVMISQVTASICGMDQDGQCPVHRQELQLQDFLAKKL